VQLQHRGRIAAHHRLREHGLPKLAGQRVVALDLARPQDLVDRVLLGRRLGAAGEFGSVDLAVGCVACQAHQLLLSLQQAQAKTLLRVLDIALDRLLLALDFLGAQIPEGADDGREKEQHGREWRQHRDRVLQHRRLASPPASPPRNGRRFHGAAGERAEDGHSSSVGEGPNATRPEASAKRVRLASTESRSKRGFQKKPSMAALISY
jgi:hypothetical protein